MNLSAPHRHSGEDNTYFPEVEEKAVPSAGGDAEVLGVEGLTVGYATPDGVAQAVGGVSFSIGRGEALGLIGESGSGKSTIALAVLRHLPPNARVEAGALFFEGRDLRGLSAEETRRLRGARIAAVYQNPGAALNPRMTVGRQVAEPLVRHGGLAQAQAGKRAVELLERVRIADPQRVAGLYAHELSGGMQQRAVIAMALALEPSLLVLDEPTTALDANTQAEIMGILDGLRRTHGTSLLLISHNIHLVRRTCERVAVMRHGSIVETGATEVVLGSPRHPYTRMLIDSLPAARAAKQDAGPAQPAVLEARAITKRFGQHDVLHGVDIEIRAGETLGLVGESGSGKSTLARIIAGLDTPGGGSVFLSGKPLRWPLEKRGSAARRAIQMVFQSPDRTLNPRHGVGRILRRPLRLLARLGGRAARERADALLAAVRLPAFFSARRPGTLSGGQRQRVAIARAFAGSPALVILDEPTSALDLSVQAEVLELLGGLQETQGAAYLLVSHDMDVVRAMADRISVLHRGRVVETGATEQVFTGPNHPYTSMLMAAASDSAAAAPRAAEFGRDCAFAARCPIGQERCGGNAKQDVEVAPGHRISCWRFASAVS